jgi:signal peptidase I
LVAKPQKIWNNENFQVAIAIVVIVTLLVGVYAAETAGYVAVVPSGSMCIPYGGACDGWTHPFARTLHVGDILIIAPINADDLNVDYPKSDIIVYNTQTFGRVVHRIAAETSINGKLAFYTKGDGNGVDKWPATPSTAEYDSWSPIPQDQIIGKVVLRIPWIGHIPLFLQGLASGNVVRILVPAIAVVVVLLVIVEFVLPIIKKRNQAADETPRQTPEQQQPTAQE